MTDVVRGCGSIILQGSEEQISAKTKSSFRDIVTQYDVKVQEYAVDRLSKEYPGACFVCEESDQAQTGSGDLIFVIDPIDGTANFVHHFRHSCTSIACVRDGRPVAGVIYNPYSDELFAAQKEKGAFLNGQRIRITDQTLSESLVLFGTAPYYAELEADTLQKVGAVYGKCQDLRRSGSAALDLSYVAAGRAGLFFEDRLSVWDYAAGALIVEEAGGYCSDLSGQPLVFDRPAKCSVIAGSRQIVQESGLISHL